MNINKKHPIGGRMHIKERIMKTATAIRKGKDFSFPDDPKIYRFDAMIFRMDEPVICFWDGDEYKKRSGFFISDLIIK